MKKVGIVKVLFSEQSLAKCPKSTDLCDQARYGGRPELSLRGLGSCKKRHIAKQMFMYGIETKPSVRALCSVVQSNTGGK